MIQKIERVLCERERDIEVAIVGVSGKFRPELQACSVLTLTAYSYSAHYSEIYMAENNNIAREARRSS